MRLLLDEGITMDGFRFGLRRMLHPARSLMSRQARTERGACSRVLQLIQSFLGGTRGSGRAQVGKILLSFSRISSTRKRCRRASDVLIILLGGGTADSPRGRRRRRSRREREQRQSWRSLWNCGIRTLHLLPEFVPGFFSESRQECLFLRSTGHFFCVHGDWYWRPARSSVQSSR